MTPHFGKLVVVVTAALLLAACAEEKAKVTLPDAPPDKLEAVEPAQAAVPEDASRSRRINGTFEARRTAGISAKVSGPVRAVFVEEGQAVEEGDKLFEIDARNFALQVEQARAAVALAETNIATLDTEFDRSRQLLAKSAIAPSQVDQLEGQLNAAKAQLDAAKVTLKIARKAQSDAVIRAPFTGVVTDVAVVVGEFAAAGPGALLTLVDEEIILRLHAPEELVGSLRPDQKLQARVPSQDREVGLVIERVNPVVSPKSRAFDVIAAPSAPDEQLRPGMFAEVYLTRDEADRPVAQPSQVNP